MNVNVLYAALFILNSSPTVAAIGDLTSALGVGGKESKVLLTEQEARQELQKKLVQQLQEHRQTALGLSEALRAELEQIRADTAQTEERKSHAETDVGRELADKELSLLQEQNQVVKQTNTVFEAIGDVLSKHIALLDAYLADSNMDSFRRELLREKGFYSFDDLKVLYRARVSKREEIESLQSRQKVFQAELDTRRRRVDRIKQDRSKLLEQRDELVKAAQNQQEETHQLAVWELERQLHEYKLRLYQYRVQEQEELIGLNKSQKFISERELQTIDTVIKQVKPKVHISADQLEQVKQRLEKRQKEGAVAKNEYDKKLERVDTAFRIAENELAEKSAEADIPLTKALEMWRIEPKATTEAHAQLCTTGALNARVKMLLSQKELLQAQIKAEDEQTRVTDLFLDIQKTFYVLRSSSDEEIAREIKRYDRLVAALEADIYSYQSQITTAETEIKSAHHSLENLEQMRKDLKEQGGQVAAGQKADYDSCRRVYDQARKLLQKRIDLIAQKKGVYSETIARLEDAQRFSEFVLSELNAITMWYRSEHAISWDGLRAAPTEISAFLRDLVSTAQSAHTWVFFGGDKAGPSGRSIAFFVMQLALWLLLLTLAGGYAPTVEQWLVHVSGRQAGFVRWLLLLFASVAGFVVRYRWAVTFAFSVWLLFALLPAIPRSVHMLVAIVAIPVFMYLADRLIRYMFSFNRAYEYALVNKEVSHRVMRVLLVLAYATIFFALFGRAFSLGDYPHSELPNILLALNFIILQIALISLISKDQILMLIPGTGRLASWVRYVVDKYYVLIFLAVIAVIVMSNPYVGFGQLVLVLTRRIIVSAALIAFFVWLHNTVKESVSTWFFAEAEDVSRERFSNAKSWYGLFVILLFAATAFFGAVILAKIWSWPEKLVAINSWSDVERLLKTPLGKYDESISVWTLLTLATYLISGFLLSMAFSRFVLRRIFDILYVDSGVQNAVESISHYIVVLTALTIGFNAVGLSSVVWWLITAFAVSFGFIIKDQIADFVSYFIILVQRPVKVGDFVQVNQEFIGVVRRITPRAVVLRNKNSKSMIVPNSSIISSPIINWNYTRGFIAFNDITVDVAYESDAHKAREVMHRVLTGNDYVLSNPRPIVWLMNFSPDGYSFMVRGYINSNYTLDQWAIESDIRMELISEFQKEGIALAVPIRLMVREQRSGGAMEHQEAPTQPQVSQDTRSE